MSSRPRHPLPGCRHQRRRARASSDGYCLMIGGDGAGGDLVEPALATLAPGRQAAGAGGRGRAASAAAAAVGYLHCGPSGAGHFVKMVHNGIEYGLMAAYAEGLNLLAHADAGLQQRERRCRDRAADQPALLPVPARHRRDRGALAPRQHHLLAPAGSDRRRAREGSASSQALPARCPTPARGAGRVQAAIEVGVPAPVLSAALYCALRVARAGGVRQQGALGDAPGVWRPRREIFLRQRVQEAVDGTP